MVFPEKVIIHILHSLQDYYRYSKIFLYDTGSPVCMVSIDVKSEEVTLLNSTAYTVTIMLACRSMAFLTFFI